MKSIRYFFSVLVIVFSFMFCNKAETPQPSVQDPEPESAEPVINPSDSVSIQIINKSENKDAFVDTVYFSDASYSGAAFPVKSGDTIMAYTTYSGSQLLYVSTRGGTTQSVYVIDSDGNHRVRYENEDMPGAKLFEIEDVKMSSKDTVFITYESN